MSIRQIANLIPYDTPLFLAALHGVGAELFDGPYYRHATHLPTMEYSIAVTYRCANISYKQTQLYWVIDFPRYFNSL
jgi:hypothetical protein